VKPVREPDAGKRHVRFDEQGWETAFSSSGFPVAACGDRFGDEDGTAPNLDSTLPRVHRVRGRGVLVDGSVYRYDRDLLRDGELSPASLYGQIVACVRPRSRVLEVGCATGYLSEYLTSRLSCKVVGVEKDSRAAEVARQRCLSIVIGDIQVDDVMSRVGALAESGYDRILLIAVLEHLAEPEVVMTKLKPMLAPGGRVIITLPNIAHWTVRRDLLLGRFEYQEYGVLDRTHLRFFTLDSATRLIEGCGFCIEHVGMEYVGLMPLRRLAAKSLPIGERLLGRLLRRYRTLTAYQFLFQARPVSN
jgi:methionine biosynthesis protein MetW